MDQLTPVLFTDDWGSRVAIASLQGRPIPTKQPESELWMGAHELGPSTLLRQGRRVTLDVVIEADPVGELGAQCVARHGSRLPFLLKVLAPGRAISIQVHPSASQAQEERARSGDAIYVDESAKPELLLAIAPFEVFVGMRPFAELVDLAELLAVPRLSRIVANAASEPEPEHAVLSAVLSTAAAEVGDFAREVVAACLRVESGDSPYVPAASAIMAIAEQHGEDVGLVVLVLMNHEILQPGEYVEVCAGVLHSYTRGLGIEVLANSDNVVRAGLTSKEVNVAELLRIVDPTAPMLRGGPVGAGDGVVEYPSVSDRFRLRQVDPGRDLPDSTGPRLVFCLRGAVVLTSSRETLRLGAVESAFLPADTGRVHVTGDAAVYLVDLPDHNPT